MNTIFDIISMKAEGLELDNNNLNKFLKSISKQSISDTQIASMLMAIFINGMTKKETMEYTKALINSGEQLKHDCNGFIIDKHSTGGVGDKVSFIVGPILAALGYFVPMIAGRSLGFTGGTIDKLESIPGYNVNLPIGKFKSIVKRVGISIIAQTDSICPLDKKIYSIRDITATIASNPLIAGSIMSKKIAEGINGLIIDMKIGEGTFIKNKSDGIKLLRLMKSIAYEHNVKFNYIMSSMNNPLGKTSGLRTEIDESIDALKGNGEKNLMEVVYSIALKAQNLAGDKKSVKKIDETISSGTAYEIFEKQIYLHGGKLTENSFKPTSELIIKAKESGFIEKINARNIGIANTMIGCGRINHKSKLDYSAGIEIIIGDGRKVKKGEPVLRAFCSNHKKIKSITDILEQSISIGHSKKNNSLLIIE